MSEINYEAEVKRVYPDAKLITIRSRPKSGFGLYKIHASGGDVLLSAVPIKSIAWEVAYNHLKKTKQTMSKFANVDIKCDNFEQIEHLAELARKEGLKVENLNEFEGLIFRKNKYAMWYSNYELHNNKVIITYADFIAEYSPQPTYTHDEYKRHVVHQMD